jgi:uncharacterized protein (TIGR03790 family)
VNEATWKKPGLRILVAGLSMLFFAPFTFPAQPISAASPGTQVIVIYNSRVPESKAVADYYAEKRQVPSEQIFGFGLTTNTDMSRAEFRDELQKPLAKLLEARKLWRVAAHILPATTNHAGKVEDWPVESKIRYAVLCYGMPIRINPEPDLVEKGTENLRPEMRRNEAAVDSELALLPLLPEKLPLAGPLRSPVYAETNVARLHPTNGVLMVTRLDGPCADIARGLVDKALQAERDGLWGRAYIDLRNTTEPGFKLGDDWLRNAGEICHRLGFETVVDENPGTFPPGFPMSQIAIYLGWYSENVCGPLAQPAVEFMPGAFAYHLHSYSADNLRTTNRNWVGPFLARGVTATMGCVFEPYLAGTPDMAVFVSRFIYAGFTFGEAAYACQQVLSWQTTVVGDPLYRPFGVNPEEQQVDLQRRHSPLLAWSYLRLLNVNLAAGKPPSQAIALLENLDVMKNSAVLSEKLGDLYASQGKPASAVYAYEAALKLDPSPQQRLRLLLSLGEKLVEQEKPEAAYESYQKLLEQFPDYPDKISIYKKLLPLALKLNKTADAEKYRALLNPEPPAQKAAAK